MPGPGDFETWEALGRNAYGTVFRGVQFSLKRDVAIFELNAALRKEAEQSPQFWNEINRLAQLNDDALVPVLAVDRDRGWIVMELVAANCSHLLGKPQSPDVARSILRQALTGLARLHEDGRRHDDVRPHTILIHRNGRVKLSLALGSAVVGGTPYHLRNMKYVAPELVSPALGEHGPRSDLYGLGFTVIELLVGPKFNGLFPGIGDENADDRTAWMRWHASPTSVLPSVRQLVPGAPHELADVLDRLIRKPSAERYESAATALQDLAQTQLVAVPVPADVGVGAAGAAALRVDIDRLHDPESRFNTATPVDLPNVAPAARGATSPAGRASETARPAATPRSAPLGKSSSAADQAARKKKKDRLTIVVGVLFLCAVLGILMWDEARKKPADQTPPALADLPRSELREGETLSAKLGSNEDAAGAKAPTYRLVGEVPEGLKLSPDGALTWTPTEAQGGTRQTFKVRAEREASPPQSVEREYSVAVAEAPAPPKLRLPSESPTVAAGETLKLAVVADDPDLPRPKLRYALVEKQPSGAVLDAASGAFTWTVPATEAAGRREFTVAVFDDGAEPLSDTAVLAVTVRAVPNRPPVPTAVSPPPARVGQAWTLTLAATDPDLPRQKLSYAWAKETKPPSGMTLDAASGAIRWTPDAATADGTHALAVEIRDDGVPPLSARIEFTIKVSGPNKPPTFATVADQTLPPEGSLAVTVRATDPDGAGGELVYALDDKQTTLSGATVDRTTGRVAWTYRSGQAGRYRVVVKATDAGTPPAEATTSFRVRVRDRNVAPEIKTLANPSVQLPLKETSGPIVALRIEVLDRDDPGGLPRFVLVDAGELRGAALDARTGLFTWTPPDPSAVRPGRYPVTVEAFDSGEPPLSAKGTFQVEVK